MVERIGRYRVTRVLGEGGMGVVYAAHDDRLDRPVAIKVVRPEALGDERARERFRREARAAASVSHPHICPLYEFDEADGEPFLVMELLEGESLSARLERGPLSLDETMTMAGAMLEALAALHSRGIIHRDLKPANVFLTRHGVKLVDFGLAQPVAGNDETREIALTRRGFLVGTPQYMAPEQLFEGRADERTDVFAAGAVIYEALSGRAAFGARTVPEILHAVGYREPERLGESPALASLDRVLRQAMAKSPDDRITSARTLQAMLREAVRHPDSTGLAPPAKPTRFVALPLRVLRADPDTDFLAFSVPDAVSVALSTFESVVVRSPQAAGSFADIRAVGRDLAVDVVLTGTILRSGQHVRVNAQLVDAAAGTIICSDVAQAPIEDLFQLQDTLTQHIVAALALPLTAQGRQSLDRHMPASADAYRLYLQANDLMTDAARWTAARELYERAVALDPGYALAWARLGRVRRLLAKWGGSEGVGLLPQAEAAFHRAFELDPDLSIAHDLAAYVDAELGRAPEAMERLLRRASTRRADTGLLAGLVTTSRYAGLLDVSRASHRRAMTIDAHVQTSVTWTYFLLGEYDLAIESDIGSPPFCALIARFLQKTMGSASIREIEARAGSPTTRLAVGVYADLFEGRVDDALEKLEAMRGRGFADPEGWYIYGFALANAGAPTPALELVRRAVEGGYACHEPLVRRAEWNPLRGRADFEEIVARTAAMVADARQRFEAADGAGALRIE